MTHCSYVLVPDGHGKACLYFTRAPQSLAFAHAQAERWVEQGFAEVVELWERDRAGRHVRLLRRLGRPQLVLA